MRKILFTVAVLVSTIGIMATCSSSALAAGFDPARIIDDGIFYNSSTMTVDQIQAFLNSKMPSCDTNGTKTVNGTTRAAYSRSNGYYVPFVCLKDYYENPITHENNLTKIDGQAAPIPAGAQSAAKIIYDAARFYNINPQVLIVTLEKESSLITEDWPWPSQYQTAMGYGCPDTGPNSSANCSSKFFGFYNQINWAAKGFRTYATYPNDYNYVPGPGNKVSYSPVTRDCPNPAYTYLNIRNQATASLYDYTPYQPNVKALAAGYGTGDGCSTYGNRNFWLYFNDWFGSTYFPQPVGGSLLYQSSSGKLFLTNGSVRFYIPTWEMVVNYGLDAFPAQPVGDDTIQQYTDGGSLTNLIYDSNGVFLVNNRTLYHVSSEMCSAWGFNCYDNNYVKSLGSNFQTQHLRSGQELTQLALKNGVIYKMINGERSPISNWQTYLDMGLNNFYALPVSTVNSVQPLGQLLVTTPGVIVFPPNSTAYYFDGTNYFAAPNTSIYSDWNLNGITRLNAPLSSYNERPPAASVLTSWYSDAQGRKFIIDQGKKLMLSPDQTNVWSSKTFTNQATTVANGLPTTQLLPYIWANGVYALDKGVRRYIPSWEDMLALGIDNSKISPLSTDKISGTPQGNDLLADGIVIALQNDTQGVYVINNSKAIRIPSWSYVTAYGFNTTNVLTYPPSILNDYTLSDSYLGSGKINNTYYLVGSGKMYTASSATAPDFGIIPSSLQDISSGLVRNTSTTPLSKFMYNADDGKIYYASGGAIHYVGSYNAFVAYGGLRIKASAVTTQTLSLFSQGQAVY